MKEYRLYKMTWQEIKEAAGKIDAVLIPVGATEQHGPHIPIDFDHFCATQLCERAAQAANAKGRWAVVAPTVSYGCSWYHMDFPGTITLSQKTFMEVLREVCESLAHHGLKNLVAVNAHGGNVAALTTCFTDLYAERRLRVALANWWTLTASAVKEMGIVSPLIHAEEIETSLALALGAEVRPGKAVRDCFSRRETHQAKGVPVSRHISYDSITPGSGVVIPIDFIHDISASGVVGDAALATKEKGDKLVEAVTSRLVELIEDLGQKK